MGQAPGSSTTRGNHHDYLGISSALKRLAPIMTDANTARILWWQWEVDGDNQNIPAWKVEAASLPSLQFFAYMQP
jgi:hypothetical protein